MTSRKKAKKKTLIISILFILLALIAGAISYLTYIQRQVEAFDQVLSENIWVNTLDIGGMTKEDAFEALQNYTTQELNQKNIEIIVKDSPISLSYNDLGITYNLEEILAEAELIGHEGTLFERYQYLKQDTPPATHFSLTASYDSAKVTELITSHLNGYYVEPIDAKMTRSNRAFQITPETDGEKPDIQAVLDQTFALLNNEETGQIAVSFIPLKPTYTKDNIKDLQTPLASFYTTYNDADPDRNINLKLASNKINTVLQPGEKFMYSKYVEPITTEAGYQSSKVILNGEVIDGVGGGICQVSSTLYSAILMTDLNIYMRRNHSLPVSYLPLGRDATYATDSVDFQFINNSGHPLYIESYCEDNKIYVNLFGHKDFKPDYESKFESVTVEILEPPATTYVNDPTLDAGVQIQKVKPAKGKKVELYKLYYKNGELLKKVHVNTSVYKPTAEVMRVGTKPVSSN